MKNKTIDKTGNQHNIFQISFRTALLAGSFILLQSCLVTRDYERPPVEQEALYRTENVAQDTTTIARISWQELFSDQYLQEYISRALQNNMDIRVALQNINIAQSYMKQGKAGNLPTLSVNAGVSYNITSENTQFGQIAGRQYLDQYELTGTLSWEADIWGRIRSNYRATNATFLQTVAAHQAVKTQLISGIATTYYQLLALDEQKKIIEKTIESRTSSLETTAALKEAGQLTQVAVNQTEALLINAKAQLIDVENNIKLTENALSLLLGEEPQEITRSALQDQSIDVDLTYGVPAQLLQNRPDVIAAEYGLINAFELTNVARANFYPSFTINATGGFQSIDVAKWFDPTSTMLNAVAALTQPLWNRRNLKTQNEVALSNKEIAWIEYQRSIITASKEVSDAIYSYQAATEKIGLKQQEFELYDESIDFSQELLNYGMANYLEVLTATENALNAELSVANTQLERLNSIVQMYKAVGGGW